MEKQGKSMDKTNLLLENLCSTMKTLVDVEEKKSKLVAQVSQAAKAAPMTGTTSTPASAPGVSPRWFCDQSDDRWSAPSHTWHRECGIATIGPEVDADQI